MATNVPYLGQGKQSDELVKFINQYHKSARADLATVFLDRCNKFCMVGGSAALVTPQSWLFLETYKKFRQWQLTHISWNLVVRLGPQAFQDMNWWAAKTQLVIVTNIKPSVDHHIDSIDVSDNRDPKRKASLLQQVEVLTLLQEVQTKNPSSIVKFGGGKDDITACLGDYVFSAKGICTGDSPRFVTKFWERPTIDEGWVQFRSSVTETQLYSGCHDALYWENGEGDFLEFVKERLGGTVGAWIRGSEAWGKQGVAVARMRNLPVALYLGELFDDNSGVLIPKDSKNLPALWCFCASDEFRQLVRELNQKVSVDNTYLEAIPFDLQYWHGVGTELYPNGFPEPHSDDPSQWLFKGDFASSTDPLQVAVARLLGYRWPEQPKEEDTIDAVADRDGIVCIPAVHSERPAAERLLDILRTAYNSQWSDAILHKLLTDAGCKPGTSLDDWLRDKFFDLHCRRFHHRPFIWHIWDGRKDGFSCLVNYHKLNHQRLETLTYAYLQDWITAQAAAARDGKPGADLRLAAAQELQDKLKLILAGEPPYDIFVRWKPIHEQPIGWNSDLNDGVRVNIRPFVMANMLRKPPNIKWTKDRGKEPERAQELFPWFWENGIFKGDRINDYHLTNAQKRAARERLAHR